MSRITTPPRRPRRPQRTPIAATLMCLALALPASAAAAQSGPTPAGPRMSLNAAPPTPRLTVLYPDITTLFNQITPDGAHIYVDSHTNLAAPAGEVESSQPWDVIANTPRRIVPHQQDFVGLAKGSPDGRSQIVWSWDPLTAVDDPGTFDLFLIHNGAAELASAGTNSSELVGKWLADDGSRMIYTSYDNIVPGDTHDGRDLYIYDAATNQISLAVPGIPDATL